MSDHVYKKIELTGSSQTGVDDAIKRAIDKAGRTIRNMRWFEVTDIRGMIDNNAVGYYQVTLKIGFTMED